MGVKKNQSQLRRKTCCGKGCLGEDNPQALLDTILFPCGIHFALCSGKEHRSLQLPQFELHVVIPEEGCVHLIYTENYSGGLQHRKVKPMCITCFANQNNPERCLVRLYQVYLSHHPADVQSFYPTPLRKQNGGIWYSKVPVGHNTLLKLLDGCVNKLELLASKRIIRFVSPAPCAYFRVEWTNSLLCHILVTGV